MHIYFQFHFYQSTCNRLISNTLLWVVHHRYVGLVYRHSHFHTLCKTMISSLSYVLALSHIPSFLSLRIAPLLLALRCRLDFTRYDLWKRKYYRLIFPTCAHVRRRDVKCMCGTHFSCSLYDCFKDNVNILIEWIFWLLNILQCGSILLLLSYP